MDDQSGSRYLPQRFPAIKDHRPDAFAVVVTGTPDDSRVAEMLKLGAHTCLPKPLDLATSTALVEEMMEQRFSRS